MGAKKADSAIKVSSARESRGGTVIWCPSCQAWSPCRAIPAPMITGDVRDYHPRWESPPPSDIRWFQRGRLCQHCGSQFLTAELDFSVVEEVIALRERMADIQRIRDLIVHHGGHAASCVRLLTNELDRLVIGKQP